MKHRLFTILSAFSLLPCLLLVYVWVRSYTNTGLEIAPGDKPRIAIEAIEGRLFLLSWEFAQFPMLYIQLPPGVTDHRAFAENRRWQSAQPGRFVWQRLGFALVEGLFQGRSYRGIMLPCWFPVLLLSVGPAAWLVLALRQRRRRKLGFCVKCGYDLRASPERCPECGTPIRLS
jgi:hypothetical protein